MSMRGESRCRCGEEPTGRTQVRYFLTEVMCRLRRGWNPSQLELNLRQADLYFEDVRLHHPLDVMRGSYLMPLVTLRTPSCGWSRTSGCTMCGYFLGSTGQRTTSPEELVEQTRWAIHRLDPRIYHTLVFTSNGSFLDPAEIPDAVRPELLRLLFGAGFRFIVVETRPGFVTSERLDAMLDVVPAIASGRDERSLSFSLGAESCSDFILSACVNKGIRARNLTESADLIRRKGFSLDCYVLLGKPFLSAREDVQDALE
ncbi:MAG TPA: hypothetical protein HPQ00_14745, partial [Magnetococcales bacterium]|nr:hypothetical protein [Magnetococcales bacterium]